MNIPAPGALLQGLTHTQLAKARTAAQSLIGLGLNMDLRHERLMDDHQRLTNHLRRFVESLGGGGVPTPVFPVQVRPRGGGAAETLHSHAEVTDFIERSLKVFSDDPSLEVVDYEGAGWRPQIDVIWVRTP